MTPPRRCLGCSTLIRRGSRCRTCAAEQKAPYSDPEYQRNRELVLARDNYECQIMRNGQPCLRYATTVDHIVPASQGGNSTVGNMQAACRSCNSGKRDR